MFIYIYIYIYLYLYLNMSYQHVILNYRYIYIYVYSINYVYHYISLYISLVFLGPNGPRYLSVWIGSQASEVCHRKGSCNSSTAYGPC